MRHGRALFFLWCFSSACIIGVLNYLRTQPPPITWLMRHVSDHPVIEEYILLDPIITTWSRARPDAEMLSEFAAFARGYPYIYLTPEATRRFVTTFSSERIAGRAQEIISVFLSPLSTEIKGQVWEDPLNLATLLQREIQPTLPPKGPGLFVGVWGNSYTDALRGKEELRDRFDALYAQGHIGSYISALHVFSSRREQDRRYREYLQQSDSIRWMGDVTRIFAEAGLDESVIQNAVRSIAALDVTEQLFLSLDTQRHRLATEVSPKLETAFLPHLPFGYVAVTYVSVPESENIDTLYTRLESLRDEAEHTIAISSPQYVALQYASFLDDLYTYVLWISVGGILLLLICGYILRLCRRHKYRCRPDEDIIYRYIDPAYTVALEENGYTTLAALMTYCSAQEAEERKRGYATHNTVHVWRHDTFTPLRTEGCDAVDTDTFFIERAWGRKARKLYREYKRLVRAKKRGVSTPTIVAAAHGYVRGLPCTCYITACAAGYRTLRDIQMSSGHTSQMCSDIARAIGHYLASLHKEGVCGIHCTADTLCVRRCPSSGAYTAISLTLHHMYMPSFLTRVLHTLIFRGAHRQRIQDLARANCALFPSLFSLRTRLFGFYAYTGRSPMTRRDRRLYKRIRQRSYAYGYAQYVYHTKDRAYHCVNTAVSDAYDTCAIHTCDDARRVAGERMTTKRGRTVERFTCNGRVFYIKKHTRDTYMRMIYAWLRPGSYTSHARDEWDALIRMQEIGIPSVVPVCMGMSHTFFRRVLFSFIVTEELHEGYSLEKWLEKQESLPLKVRCHLVDSCAQIAQKLHCAGYTHRDFYVGHIYVVGSPHATYRLHLLDLQRLRKGARRGNRWSIKDICALYFSVAPLACVTGTDYMRFIHAYFGVDRCDWAIKHFIYHVLRKADRVARHTEKLLTRRRARGELPVKVSEKKTTKE